MTPPITPPTSAESLWDWTLNSSMVSMMGFRARLLKKVAWLFTPSSMYMLLRLIWPLTDGMLDWPVPIAVTPGVRRIRFWMFLPAGRSTTCCRVSTLPNSAVALCNCTPVASTLTESCTLPTARAKSKTDRWFTTRLKGSSRYVLNPGLPPSRV